MANCVILPTISELPLPIDEQVLFNQVDSLFNQTLNKQENKEKEYIPLHKNKIKINQLFDDQLQSNQLTNSNYQFKYIEYPDQNSNIQYNHMQFYNSYEDKMCQDLKNRNKFQDIQLRNNYLQSNQTKYSPYNLNYTCDYCKNSSLFIANSLIPQKDKLTEEKKVNHVKGFWSHEEDEKLIAAVTETKPCVWEIVASKVPGRSPIQCKERWLYRLHPDVNKAKFEKWEDEIIINERKKIGNSWTYISTKLNGRTSLAVKNRWYSVLRKELK